MRGKSAELESISHKPRIGRIWLFIIVIASFNFTFNYMAGQLAQTERLFQVKLGWKPNSKQETAAYTYFNTIGYVGACIGAVVGNKLIGFGRRNTLFSVSGLFLLMSSLA